MELADVIRRRRMVRSFTPDPLPPGALDTMLSAALHAPSAGFSQGWAFLVLEGVDETARFWDATFPLEERATFAYPGLFRAPAIVIALSHKDAYLDRYAEPDKGWTDRSESHWPVPYWDVDTGMAAMAMLLAAVDEGLGALFFGVPEAYTPVGAITVGWPAPDTPSPSLARGRRTAADVVHRGRW